MYPPANPLICTQFSLEILESAKISLVYLYSSFHPRYLYIKLYIFQNLSNKKIHGTFISFYFKTVQDSAVSHNVYQVLSSVTVFPNTDL